MLLCLSLILLSRLLQDPRLFCLFQTPPILQSCSCSSQILDPNSSYPPISSQFLQDPRSSLLQNHHSSKILNHKVENNAVFVKLLTSSNLVTAPPRSWFFENPHPFKILNHQIAHNASLFKLLQSHTGSLFSQNRCPLQALDLLKVYFSFWFAIPFNVV